MRMIEALLLAGGLSMAISTLVWGGLRRRYGRRFAAAQGQHREAQRTAHDLLRQCRCQLADHKAAVAQSCAAAREEEAHQADPSDGFQDTVIEYREWNIQQGRASSCHGALADGFADTVIDEDSLERAWRDLHFAKR